VSTREFHWRVTGWRASLIGSVILAIPFGIVFALGFIAGRVT
jgi:hypothetical protein